jgi:hypothetical protein
LSDLYCLLGGAVGGYAEIRGENRVDDEVRGAVRVAGRSNYHGAGELSLLLAVAFALLRDF